MELHDVLPPVVKTLMTISMGGLFLSMLFVDKIRLNGKERGGRNIVITLAISLITTLIFSIITTFLLHENVTVSLSSELMSDGAKIFSFLTILAFMPVLLALFKIGILLARRKQNHA
jgi:cytochrome bd-type quinol oxidase subunit 2